MKIHGVKLNKKNFWIPLIGFTIFSFLIYFLGSHYLSYKFIGGGTGNTIPYYIYLLESLMTTLLYYLPFLLFLMLIPVFFIIRRLLSKEPKKVFYFELPILIVIYFIYNIYSTVGGLMIGGPMLTASQFLTLILFPIFFIAVWLSILTISLYFYYKKFVK